MLTPIVKTPCCKTPCRVSLLTVTGTMLAWLPLFPCSMPKAASCHQRGSEYLCMYKVIIVLLRNETEVLSMMHRTTVAAGHSCVYSLRCTPLGPEWRRLRQEGPQPAGLHSGTLAQQTDRIKLRFCTQTDNEATSQKSDSSSSRFPDHLSHSVLL